MALDIIIHSFLPIKQTVIKETGFEWNTTTICVRNGVVSSIVIKLDSSDKV